MRSTAMSRFAVSSTTVGFCPPSSKIIGVRFSAAARMITLPTAELPVKKIKSKGSSNNAVISSLPPVTILTASGAKYLGISS
ncbi:hypothetical protein D3C81_1881730 [compost metagenome]